MSYGFTGNAVWQLVAQSDLVTQGVLLLLLSMSILCWALFLYKCIVTRIKIRQLEQATRALEEVNSIDDVKNVANSLVGTLPGYFLKRNLYAMRALLEKNKGEIHAHSSVAERIQFSVDQTVEDSMYAQESYLQILFSCAAVAPLLGLFGTVWGLVHSFIRISQKQSADIATVAPGIAEALITTLAGLLVAIPALMMYHYLIARNRTVEYYLYLLSDRFMWLVGNYFL
jgi:biopolymer transport protein TolQ